MVKGVCILDTLSNAVFVTNSVESFLRSLIVTELVKKFLALYKT